MAAERWCRNSRLLSAHLNRAYFLVAIQVHEASQRHTLARCHEASDARRIHGNQRRAPSQSGIWQQSHRLGSRRAMCSLGNRGRARPLAERGQNTRRGSTISPPFQCERRANPLGSRAWSPCPPRLQIRRATAQGAFVQRRPPLLRLLLHVPVRTKPRLATTRSARVMLRVPTARSAAPSPVRLLASCLSHMPENSTSSLGET